MLVLPVEGMVKLQRMDQKLYFLSASVQFFIIIASISFLSYKFLGFEIAVLLSVSLSVSAILAGLVDIEKTREPNHTAPLSHEAI